MTLEFHDGDEMNHFFFGDDSNKEKIYESITKSISKGISNKMDIVPVWEITFNNGDDDLIIDCERKDWNENLGNALNWYIEQEEYEKCTYIKNLINKL